MTCMWVRRVAFWQHRLPHSSLMKMFIPLHLWLWYYTWQTAWGSALQDTDTLEQLLKIHQDELGLKHMACSEKPTEVVLFSLQKEAKADLTADFRCLMSSCKEGSTRLIWEVPTGRVRAAGSRTVVWDVLVGSEKRILHRKGGQILDPAAGKAAWNYYTLKCITSFTFTS